jgi:hypothetical protein
MIRMFVAVLAALLVILAIFRQMSLEHEERQVERNAKHSGSTSRR